MFNFSLRAFVALFVFLSVSSVSAQTKVVVIPLFGDDAPAPTEYAIGDTGPAGGIVFHATNGGLNGLEAALVDQSPAPWNCPNTDVNGVANLANSGDLDPQQLAEKPRPRLLQPRMFGPMVKRMAFYPTKRSWIYCTIKK